MKHFNDLYKEHYKSVFRLAFRFVKNHESAADIAQDVFVYLYKNHVKNAKIENEKAWLFKVTSNLCLAYLRKSKKKAELNKEIQNETLEENQSSSEVLFALQNLKEPDRVLLTLYNEGLSYKELSEATGIKFTSVGKTLSRAIKRLKDEVERRK